MKKTRRAAAFIWQRGYRGHTLWHKEECVGRISLGQTDDWDGVYRCQAGTLTGETTSLKEAKRWIREKAKLNLVQLSLF
ncbi:hypothetical protein SAMN06265795_11470 [Noviherbaspirillum humi]|uniref:Uncharacterized protein n=1 Tax=Noviherbaspirillum humi TaxID=1688639 RepID=A0A239JZI9_9BURK|nr:hypothetical protein [Noviherbaspirillum humi]SNT11486.1 hypothetical protein SAMN06265795_11470 [Noviherbaspirillum humi]